MPPQQPPPPQQQPAPQQQRFEQPPQHPGQQQQPEQPPQPPQRPEPHAGDQQQPPQRPEPQQPPQRQVDRYEARPDGGFGPMGSKARSSTSRSGRGSRRTSWTAEEIQPESREREFSTGGYRPGEAGPNERGPQFLLEADDVYDEEYGGGRLVAPPVLGEAPPGYRDF
ncbi:hypothetical protein [Saccharopolyspora gloriosae]|uniref:hypothetical protein n=1 Tax=Saccharopolyspora gloriosae TaxID=455344 RepID=UPI001FB7E15E|nr:hypothetical protein [Saccharopolyspora gloriosae]